MNTRRVLFLITLFSLMISIFVSAQTFSTAVDISQSFGMDLEDWYQDNHTLLVGDFNGDGNDDVLLQANTSEYSTYLLMGSPSGLTSRENITNQFGGSKWVWNRAMRYPYIGDFNGDGRDDLLLQGRSTTADTFLFFGSDVGFNYREKITNSYGTSIYLWSRSNRTMFVGNFNGDQYDDILLQANSGTGDSFLLTGNGGGFDYRHKITNSFGTSVYVWLKEFRELRIGDFNGDGNDDVLLQSRTNTGNSFLLTGNSSSIFNYRQIVTTSFGMNSTYSSGEINPNNAWASYSEANKATIIDYDCDGDDDIIFAAVINGIRKNLVLAGSPSTVFESSIILNHSIVTFESDKYIIKKGDFDSDQCTDFYFQGITDRSPIDTYNSYVDLTPYELLDEEGVFGFTLRPTRPRISNTPFPIYTRSNGLYSSVFILDANGDGYSDAIWIDHDFYQDNPNTEKVLFSQIIPPNMKRISENVPVEKITSYSLAQNYPNPFNPITSIEYQIPEAGFVSLEVFDIMGRKVSTLVNSVKDPGKHSVTFDATNLASGTYIYIINTGHFKGSQKMFLIK